jgi:hypothetical protein
VPDMRTADLIRAITEDGATRGPSLAGRLAVALLVGGSVAVVLFAVFLGVRADIGSAMHMWRFVFKVILALLAYALALWACARLTSPQVGVRDTVVGLVAAPVLLAAAVGYELLTVPPADWYTRALGSNSRVCLVAIPLLSLAPLAGALAALRVGAPQSPGTAGAVAGLMAGTLAATLYAVHCPDDSPLFVALWYSLAVAIVALLGAIVGRRVLDW